MKEHRCGGANGNGVRNWLCQIDARDCVRPEVWQQKNQRNEQNIEFYKWVWEFSLWCPYGMISMLKTSAMGIHCRSAIWITPLPASIRLTDPVTVW